MRALCAMIRQTSRAVVCGRIGSVRVCNEPLYSSGIITRNTDEQAGNEDDRNCKIHYDYFKIYSVIVLHSNKGKNQYLIFGKSTKFN